MRTEISGNHVYLYTSYSLKEACASITGRRWDHKKKAWVVPLTPFTASALCQRFSAHLPDDQNTLLLRNMGSRLLVARQVIDGKVEITFQHKIMPWQHQRVGYSLASVLLGLSYVDDVNLGGGCMLAFDMGAGKTKITVDLIQNYRKALQRVLVVCPAKAIDDVWERQFPEHAFHNDYIIKGSTETSVPERVQKLYMAQQRAKRENKQFIGVINYEAAWREPMASWIKDTNFDLVVLDEIHRIKANNGKASRYFASLFDVVPRRLGLTGTPLPHSMLDAFGEYRFLDPGVFGTVFGIFRGQYTVMGGFQGKQVLAFRNEDDFNTKFYSIAHRVKTDEVLDLPESTDITREFELAGVEAKAYKEMDRDLYTQIFNEEVTAANALVKVLRLQEITSGVFVDTGESGKIQLLQEILEDLPPHEPVVVVAKFTKDIERIKTIVEAGEYKRTCGILDGHRNDLQAWKAGQHSVLAMQIQAGKEGIDLTRSRYAIIYSIGFSLGDYLQMRRRFRRPGQTRNVVYIHLIAKKTIDAKIMKVLAWREAHVESVLNTDRDFIEAVLKEYKNEEQ